MKTVNVAKIAALVLTLGVTGCEQGAPPSDGPKAGFRELGRELVAENCVSCHNIS